MSRSISTARLRLRPLRTDDEAAFAAIHADPAVMEFLGGTLDRSASDALVNRVIAHREQHGFAPWCVERAGEVIGWCGLLVPAFHPSVEIGWRLTRDAWGYGYATEAAVAVLADWFSTGIDDRSEDPDDVVTDDAFTDEAVDEVISFTAVDNHRSRAVMERIGLVRDPDADFDHPALASGHPLRRHVLYRIRRAEWRPPTSIV